MNEVFQRVEARLQTLFEDGAVRLFNLTAAGGSPPEQQLARHLVEAMQNQTLLLEDGVLVAPTQYTLAVNPAFAQDVRANQALLEKLGEGVRVAAIESGLRQPGEPVIEVVADETVSKGHYRIWAVQTEEHADATEGLDFDEELAETPIPSQAFLIVAGSQIYPLEEIVVNIGRRLENQLVIDDPRVSRHHAQMRAIKGRYRLFDLESSGGTFVNDERISEATLHPGDVISLAGYPLVYAQDAVQRSGDTRAFTSDTGTHDTSAQK
jgi:hypothetical protein